MRILIIGAGFMAKEYAKVLSYMKVDFDIVTRSEVSCLNVKAIFPDIRVFSGGIESFVPNQTYSHAIICSNVGQLANHGKLLIELGIPNILIEKPGGINVNQLESLLKTATNKDVNLKIGYNRRFYSSSQKLKELVLLDGGITNVHFEFTEWVHTIDVSIYHPDDLQRWVIANSSHVIDLVFYLIGFPKDINSMVEGKGKIEWHPSSSIFVGSGLSEHGVPFSYNTNWLSAGRWSIEVSTKKRRFYLRPMEKLYEQIKGELTINEIQLNNDLDITFKAGLFNQTESFIKNDFSCFVSLEDQIKAISIYEQIAGY